MHQSVMVVFGNVMNTHLPLYDVGNLLWFGDGWVDYVVCMYVSVCVRVYASVCERESE